MALPGIPGQRKTAGRSRYRRHASKYPERRKGAKAGYYACPLRNEL